jgi:hypothetical protein
VALSRWLKLIALLVVAWCVMVVAHECGHLLGGWLGGGTLQHVELRPWRLPHSLFMPDPKPLVTLCAGPLFGVGLPLLIAIVVRGSPRAKVGAWFIADFCLLANGAYLAAAWISGDRHLDTPRLLAAGASPLAIGAFCAAAIGIGYLRFRADCLAVVR